MVEVENLDLLNLLNHSPASGDKQKILDWAKKRKKELKSIIKARKMLAIALIVLSVPVSFIALIRSDESWLSAIHLFLSTGLMTTLWIYIGQIRLKADRDLVILDIIEKKLMDV